jgi:alanyl-tRNA synthetase
MEVEDAKRIGETIVHIGKMLSGRIAKGETAKVTIDDGVRRRIMANHTATHLLQAALRKVLGDHVRQTGSLVDQDHLRFDFTHMKKMSDREITRVEELVNEAVKRAISVRKEVRDIETARQEGAIALFGEKYGAKVRVVTIGDISKELCGGTHVDNTKDIGLFRIRSENSIAAGTRRIEALTGEAAKKWIDEQSELERARLAAENEKEAAKSSRSARLKEVLEGLEGLIARGRPLGGARAICEVIEDADMEMLRSLADRIREREKGAVMVLATKDAEKASFIIAVPQSLAKDRILNAGELAKELSGAIAGSGGGRPDFAQGGGRDPAKLEEALKGISKVIEEKLK